ncbi:MAG: hypothetical protein ABI741_06570 [Ferruginibacter sp.]
MKLIKTILLVIFVSFQTTSFSQNTGKESCKILRDCRLKYLDIEDTTSYVIIKDTAHIEYHDAGKYYIRSTLKWLNDCDYDMTMTEITIPGFPFHPGDIRDEETL